MHCNVRFRNCITLRGQPLAQQKASGGCDQNMLHKCRFNVNAEPRTRLLLDDLAANFSATVCRRMNVCIGHARKQKLLERIAVDGCRNLRARIERNDTAPRATLRTSRERSSSQCREIQNDARICRCCCRTVNVTGGDVGHEPRVRHVIREHVGRSIERRRERACGWSRDGRIFRRTRQRGLERDNLRNRSDRIIIIAAGGDGDGRGDSNKQRAFEHVGFPGLGEKSAG